MSELPDGLRALAAGPGHTCALLYPEARATSVLCWGKNDVGQLGTGAAGDAASSPIPVLTLR